MATVSKNIFWSSLSSLLQLYTGSVVFIVLAKLMSVHDFGILSFGFSLSALAAIVADFGFSLMIIKYYPQNSNHKRYLSNSILAKIILAIGSGVLFFAYLLVFYQGDWIMIGGLYILFAIIASFTVYLQALLRVQNRFDAYTESGIVYAIVITISVLAYWQFDLSLPQLVFCLLGCKILQLFWTVYRCKNSFQLGSYKLNGVSRLLKNSWSFGVFGVLGIFYFMIDTQIISLYLGAKEVALYQSVFRIVLILMVFSDIVSNVMLPYLSFKFFNQDDVSELVSKIFLYLLIIGCSWFLAFTSFKVELLELLYTPEYQAAATLVLPFSIVVILRTVSTLLGNILTISNRQAHRVLTVSVSLAVSLALNLVLIPKYGIKAAAWVSVLVHVILFSMYLVYSKMEVPSMKLLSLSSMLVLAVSVAIYAMINHFTNGGLWIVLGCIPLWLLVIYGAMKRNNNFRFLQEILKEKGVG